MLKPITHLSMVCGDMLISCVCVTYRNVVGSGNIRRGHNKDRAGVERGVVSENHKKRSRQ